MTQAQTEKKTRKKRRKMNAFYMVATILFIIAVLLLFCATALMLLKTAKENTSFVSLPYDFEKLSTYAGMAASGIAFIGIIFAGFSKSKKKNKMVIMNVTAGVRELQAINGKNKESNPIQIVKPDTKQQDNDTKEDTPAPNKTDNNNMEINHE